MNRGNGKRKLGFQNDTRVPFARAGWNDALHGRPFDYALVDNAPDQACALAYETARLRVMALQAHGERVPAWRAANIGPKIREAITTAGLMNKAHRIHGTGGFWPVGPSGHRAAA
jgi:hypothetical protein